MPAQASTSVIERLKIMTDDQSDNVQRFLELGISPEQADQALRFLGADGADPPTLQMRCRFLVALSHACGSFQNAKLAYSLATRSGHALDNQGVKLLTASLRCCDCAPAAVRLWKASRDAGVGDEELLVTAGRLGGDGAEIVKLLESLNEQPEVATMVAELSRQLTAPGWQAEGSWGARPDPLKGLIWWDFARESERRPYGMTLTSDPITLTGTVGTQFCFEARWEISGVTDRCHLEISKDGGKKWDKLARYEGVQDWALHTIDLREYDGHTVRLRFHVVSGGHREGRGFEMADPRLVTVPVRRRLGVTFSELPDGWRCAPGTTEDRSSAYAGHDSEVALVSDVWERPDLESPTLTFDGRLMSSSVYATAHVEILDEAGEAQAVLTVPSTSEWKNLRLPLESVTARKLRVRLQARFNKRKDDDGLWVRKLTIQGGEPKCQESVALDGGAEDGPKERQALLQVLATGSPQKLAILVELRKGLSSLRDALALLPFVTDTGQISVLLKLFSALKDEAVPTFVLLQELASGEDLHLQSSVLLMSGPKDYSSTRDYLGDGLLSAEEFEQNCHLYLDLRKSWREEAARGGLSLLLTPVADETLAERHTVFRALFQQGTTPEDFFLAWEQAWS